MFGSCAGPEQSSEADNARRFARWRDVRSSWRGGAFQCACNQPPMNRKRLLECGAAVALALTLLGASGIYLYYRGLDDALMAASRKGDVRAVQRLLDRGANPNVRGTGPLSKMRADRSATPLHIAAGVPSGAVVKELLRRGADPNAQDDAGGTALFLAASACHLDVTQILLRSGADPNIRGHGGWTALMYAMENGDTAIIKELLAANARVQDVNDQGQTALVLAHQRALVIRRQINSAETRWKRRHSGSGSTVPARQRDEFARIRSQTRKRYERIAQLLDRAGARN